MRVAAYALSVLLCLLGQAGASWIQIEQTADCMTQPLRIGQFQWIRTDFCFQLTSSSSGRIQVDGSVISYSTYTDPNCISGASLSNITSGQCDVGLPFGGRVTASYSMSTISALVADWIYQEEFNYVSPSNCTVASKFRISSSLSHCITNEGGAFTPQWQCDGQTPPALIFQRGCSTFLCSNPNTCTGSSQNVEAKGACTPTGSGNPLKITTAGPGYLVCLGNGATVAPTTAAPSMSPSSSPTSTPTTAVPTSQPSVSPTTQPTVSPTQQPSSAPTLLPTSSPSTSPSISPTSAPTRNPTASPTERPTAAPSNPTPAPTPSSAISNCLDIAALIFLFVITQ